MMLPISQPLPTVHIMILSGLICLVCLGRDWLYLFRSILVWKNFFACKVHYFGGAGVIKPGITLTLFYFLQVFLLLTPEIPREVCCKEINNQSHKSGHHIKNTFSIHVCLLAPSGALIAIPTY